MSYGTALAAGLNGWATKSDSKSLIKFILAIPSPIQTRMVTIMIYDDSSCDRDVTAEENRESCCVAIGRCDNGS